MNVGIIGFGLIGQQRARAIAGLPAHRVAAVYDPDSGRANKLAAEMNYVAVESHRAILERDDVDVVLIAVPHICSRDLVIEALGAGKHVFCEKPLGRDAADCRMILKAAERAGTCLGAGFNYRFYPGIQEAHRRIRNGDIGTVTHMRFIMGHGGRPGMEKEWKTSKELCGGGALLDPGIHILDLVRFLAGPVRSANANLQRTFWNIDVEDNAFVTIETESGSVAQCHISITEWKSTFTLDIFGTEGSVHVHGRGGFYGPHRFQYHRRWGWLEKESAPEPEIRYAPEDVSFRAEMDAYFDRISGKHNEALGTGADGLAALEVIERLYESTPVSGLSGQQTKSHALAGV